MSFESFESFESFQSSLYPEEGRPVEDPVATGLPPAICHLVVQRDQMVPPRMGLFGDVLIARNGLFFHGSAPGIADVVMPLGPWVPPIPGALGRLAPSLTITTPPIPRRLVEMTVDACQREARYPMGPREIVFHFWFDDARQQWRRACPRQRQSRFACQPLATGPGSSYERAVCELHSHHVLPPRFSLTDDRDETALRFYAVVGTVLMTPTINLRLGYHGHFWPVPAATLFELPRGMADLNSMAVEEVDDGSAGEPLGGPIGETREVAPEGVFTPANHVPAGPDGDVGAATRSVSQGGPSVERTGVQEESNADE